MAGSSLVGLRWTFANVNEFCKDSCTKHETKGFKYYNEKYVHDISGEFFYVIGPIITTCWE